MNTLRLCLAATLCAALAGCSDGGLPMVEVYGTVTYEGGPWPKPGNVTFTPLESNGALPQRSGSGAFDVDGKFVAGSFRPGDGLVPGKYGVSVSCMKGIDLTTPLDELNYVPADFKPNASPIQNGVLEVKEGDGAIDLLFDVPKKK